MLRIVVLTLFTMLAFSGNSLLCRAALLQTDIDAASFTSIRLVSGALMLWLLVSLRANSKHNEGSWLSAATLFIYAATLSFAYAGLPAGLGAILLFGAVQVTMISWGIKTGECFSVKQWLGLVLAFAGLIGLMLPGVSAPPLISSLLMIGSGVAWGLYSLRGKGTGNPIAVTAGNFARAVPFSIILSVLFFKHMSLDPLGVAYAITSGAITSGLGYTIWYTVVPALRASSAATIQLCSPVLTSIAGVVFLQEELTLRLLLSSVVILGGIALVIYSRQPR